MSDIDYGPIDGMGLPALRCLMAAMPMDRAEIEASVEAIAELGNVSDVPPTGQPAGRAARDRSPMRGKLIPPSVYIPPPRGRQPMPQDLDTRWEVEPCSACGEPFVIARFEDGGSIALQAFDDGRIRIFTPEASEGVPIVQELWQEPRLDGKPGRLVVAWRTPASMDPGLAIWHGHQSHCRGRVAS